MLEFFGWVSNIIFLGIFSDFLNDFCLMVVVVVVVGIYLVIINWW